MERPFHQPAPSYRSGTRGTSPGRDARRRAGGVDVAQQRDLHSSTAGRPSHGRPIDGPASHEAPLRRGSQYICYLSCLRACEPTLCWARKTGALARSRAIAEKWRGGQRRSKRPGCRRHACHHTPSLLAAPPRLSRGRAGALFRAVTPSEPHRPVAGFSASLAPGGRGIAEGCAVSLPSLPTCRRKCLTALLCGPHEVESRAPVGAAQPSSWMSDGSGDGRGSPRPPRRAPELSGSWEGGLQRNGEDSLCMLQP